MKLLEPVSLGTHCAEGIVTVPGQWGHRVGGGDTCQHLVASLALLTQANVC